MLKQIKNVVMVLLFCQCTGLAVYAEDVKSDDPEIISREDVSITGWKPDFDPIHNNYNGQFKLVNHSSRRAYYGIGGGPETASKKVVPPNSTVYQGKYSTDGFICSLWVGLDMVDPGLIYKYQRYYKNFKKYYRWDIQQAQQGGQFKSTGHGRGGQGKDVWYRNCYYNAVSDCSIQIYGGSEYQEPGRYIMEIHIWDGNQTSTENPQIPTPDGGGSKEAKIINSI